MSEPPFAFLGNGRPCHCALDVRPLVRPCARLGGGCRKGDWSDGDVLWDDYPGVRAKLNPVRGASATSSLPSALNQPCAAAVL